MTKLSKYGKPKKPPKRPYSDPARPNLFKHQKILVDQAALIAQMQLRINAQSARIDELKKKFNRTDSTLDRLQTAMRRRTT